MSVRRCCWCGPPIGGPGTSPAAASAASETPEAAARRELNEEIGLAAPELLAAGVASGVWDGRPDRVHFFQLRLDRLPGLRLDNREIIQARLMPPSEWHRLPVTGPVAAYLRSAAR